MEIPGKVGWPVVGDKSLDFYKDPMQFVNRNVSQAKCQIFKTRFLNRPTAFVCSNQGVRDVLNNTGEHLEFGYEAFLKGLFDHNILFSKEQEAQQLRQCFASLFSEKCCCDYNTCIEKIIRKHVDDLNIDSEPICMYKFFKHLFMDICLSLFLGFDSTERAGEAAEIHGHVTDHWRGLVAVPLDITLVKKSSTYGKALQAKKNLLETISVCKRQAKHGFPVKMQEMSSTDETVVNNHILLFTCALLPKVLASICTSLCMATGNPDTIHYQERARCEETWLEHLLLETIRLWPPLAGGRRLARKDCFIEGYKVPADYAIVYMLQPAHRDSAVFEDAELFKPERWLQRPDLKDKLYSFGLGSRCCIGKHLSNMILTATMKYLLSKFTVHLVPDQDLNHKILPVLRPNNSMLAHLRAV